MQEGHLRWLCIAPGGDGIAQYFVLPAWTAARS
jgi:hypothetical protein